jgi:hypothetical protein
VYYCISVFMVASLIHFVILLDIQISLYISLLYLRSHFVPKIIWIILGYNINYGSYLIFSLSDIHGSYKGVIWSKRFFYIYTFHLMVTRRNNGSHKGSTYLVIIN